MLEDFDPACCTNVLQLVLELVEIEMTQQQPNDLLSHLLDWSSKRWRTLLCLLVVGAGTCGSLMADSSYSRWAVVGGSLTSIVLAYIVIRFLVALPARLTVLLARLSGIIFGSQVLDDKSVSGDVVVESMVRRIRRRARVSQVGAAASVTLILLSLVVGLFFFFYAGVITQNDQNYFLIQNIADAEHRLAELNMESRKIEGSISHDSHARYKEQINSQERRLEKLNETLAETKTADTLFVVSTLATRLGAAALLLFLIQILVPMYRYNARLVAFYHARADVLQLCDKQDPGYLNELAGVLSPDAVEFGKAPRTPTQELVDLVAQISSIPRGIKAGS